MRSRRAWGWAFGLSFGVHAGAALLPSPSRAERHAVRSLEVRLSRKVETPPPPPPPEPEPAPPPEKPRARAPEPSPARPEAPRPPPQPVDAPPPAPEPPRSAAPAAPPPDLAAVDLELKPRFTRPGRRASGVRAGGGAPAGTASAPAVGPELEPKSGGRYLHRHRGFDAIIERDGSVRFSNKASVTFLDRGSQMTFDTSELAMKAAGQDPFLKEKTAFMEQTRALRLQMRARAEHEALLQSERTALRRIRSIWTGPGSARERRRRLFGIWDGCAESGDEAHVRAGQFMRATVEGFIRRELPSDHPDGFSAEELAALNDRRASEARFDPYATEGRAR